MKKTRLNDYGEKSTSGDTYIDIETQDYKVNSTTLTYDSKQNKKKRNHQEMSISEASWPSFLNNNNSTDISPGSYYSQPQWSIGFNTPSINTSIHNGNN